jgi:hypothetical protein
MILKCGSYEGLVGSIPLYGGRKRKFKKQGHSTGMVKFNNLTLGL